MKNELSLCGEKRCFCGVGENIRGKGRRALFARANVA